MKKIIILFFLISFKIIANSNITTWNFDIGIGLLFGSLKKVALTSNSYSYGGLPVYLAINKDFLPKITLGLHGHFINDLYNTRISRYGLEIGLIFYLLGGVKHTIYTSDYTEIIKNNSYGLGFTIQSGTHNYNALSTISIDSVTGTLLDTKLGILFRYDLNRIHSIKLAIFRAIYSLPVGSERIETSLSELIATWNLSL